MEFKGGDQIMNILGKTKKAPWDPKCSIKPFFRGASLSFFIRGYPLISAGRVEETVGQMLTISYKGGRG